MKQLSIFDKPKQACAPSEGQKVKYAIKEADLSGLTIKEQFNRLAAVAGGPGHVGHYNLDRLLKADKFDYWDSRDNWIDIPEYLAKRVCEVFDLSQFPVNPAPMPRPVSTPWYEKMMEKPEAPEYILNLPRDKYIVMGTGNPYVQPQERHVLGPYQTIFAQDLPLKDRAEVRDFMRQHPNLNHLVAFDESDTPRRVMPEETKIKIRTLNMMRRAVKKYGMFAEDFARQECADRGWEWSDEIWQRANTPPKKSKKAWGGKKKKGRSTDNDEFMAS